MTTDEQIIAAAGEPVAHVVKDDEGEQLMYPAAIFKYKMASEEDIICDLYTADAILAAAKPLRERIAELEAEVDRLKAECDKAWSINPTTSEQLLLQKNAELTKQRDELFETLETAYDVTVNHDDRLHFDWAVYCEMLHQSISSVKNFK